MNRDLENKSDIEVLINSFYDRVKKDDTIGYIFNETIGADWSHHLPRMYDFWNMVLFSKPGYAGNPTRAHVDLDKKTPLKKEHFDRWVVLWNETVDSLYSGKIADLAKNRASLMANLISMKVEMSHDSNFIQ
jgi:hemoglobin